MSKVSESELLQVPEKTFGVIFQLSLLLLLLSLGQDCLVINLGVFNEITLKS